jgi:hypothetical protein
MDRWSPFNPPLDWEQVRDHWLYYHHLRSVVEIIGFLALLSAAMMYANGE